MSANGPLNKDHPAYIASLNSVKHVTAGNKQGWLDLFADDAVVQDPVGVSPLDPTGRGHAGRAAIEQFWDTIIGPGNIRFDVRESYPAGDECANVATLTNTMPGGVDITTNLVIVYRVNEAGKIVSLKAYWEYAGVQEQIERAMGPA